MTNALIPIPGFDYSAAVTWGSGGSAFTTAGTIASDAGSIIRRSGDGGATWQTLATLAPGVSNYTDPLLVQNTNYTYSVTAESASESVPNLSIATSPNTGILGGGHAFIPNVTDGNKDAVGNAMT
jgi:hypothetical protein